jgi:hypothetical protein
MSDLNNKNTGTVVRQAHDRVSTMLAHFHDGGTWEELTQGESWIEMLKVDLVMLAQVVEHRLQELHAVEPQEFGT